MPDEIIEELWKIKDSMAREHGNDVRKLAAYLRERSSQATQAPKQALIKRTGLSRRTSTTQ